MVRIVARRLVHATSIPAPAVLSHWLKRVGLATESTGQHAFRVVQGIE
jgi:hypothetical protein